FFIPNVLHNYILRPAVYSIYPAITDDLIEPIQIWHGFNTEIMMTIGIIIVGLIIYYFKDQFMKIYTLFPYSLSFNNLYSNSLKWSDKGAKIVTQFYMTRFLRHYLAYIFIVFVVLLSSYMYYLNAFSFSLNGDEAMTPFVWIIIATIGVAGLTMIIVPSRLAIILVNGYIGFAIALLFVVFRAPDLALTQLVVETITTTLFLLCFYFLPKWRRERFKLDWYRFLIAISVGVTFTVVALSVKSGRLFDSFVHYFEDADILAGVSNIVNLILADFRTLDTRLELIVLFIAGIVVFFLLALALYLFFAVHHAPGGGFIGGLVLASAFVLVLLSYDIESLQKGIPIDFKFIAATGALIVLISGFAPLLFGKLFLYQTFLSVHIPVYGELELSTVTF